MLYKRFYVVVAQIFVYEVDVTFKLWSRFRYIVSDSKKPSFSPCNIFISFKVLRLSSAVMTHWSWIAFTGVLDIFVTRIENSFPDWAWLIPFLTRQSSSSRCFLNVWMRIRPFRVVDTRTQGCVSHLRLFDVLINILLDGLQASGMYSCSSGSGMRQKDAYQFVLIMVRWWRLRIALFASRDVCIWHVLRSHRARLSPLSPVIRNVKSDDCAVTVNFNKQVLLASQTGVLSSIDCST